MPELRADCTRCFALCCVAPAFSVSADFAIDKPSGQPCRNLRPDFRCAIHDQLGPRGFPGCRAYDCFGAGQRVSQVTFGGRDWRRAPATADRMFRAFRVMRQLHELLWYLREALALPPARALHRELRVAYEEIERLTTAEPDGLLAVDLDAHWQGANTLLLHTSELVRAESGRRGADLRRADLVGKDLRRTDLRGADLRGAYLIQADLRGVDLAMADLIGADLRGADLRGADLGRGVFLTQSQVGAAVGDGGTRLPPALARPAHWPTARPPGHSFGSTAGSRLP